MNIKYHTELKIFEKCKTDLSISTCGLLLKANRIVIPQSLHEKVIGIAHEGHQGICKTKQNLRERVWFPFMDKKIENFINECISCQSCNPSEKITPLCMSELPSAPWTELSMDFRGPLSDG